MTYPHDPYGQPPMTHDPIYAARRRMQGWWATFAVLFVLGLVISAAYSATLVPHTNPYIHTMQPTTMSYVLLAIGVVNGIVGTVAFIIAIRATRECSQIKQSMYGGF
ncbi:hypothetical protein MMAG44476_20104 [Mycolicibacterium mageritense DSM 44476 = CIP 104973]|uniref:Uncharacterized protein n=1 Tax=Mycolicibacterium mageritense TaxID=53462 RepID=A0ABM7I6G3_MYCME|nr:MULTISPECIES: hypothetical protein [Mycobacteriaceae]MDO3357785.1 hypothetical protein [Mycobacteroides abscessus subsp. massiliense]WKE45644.1 hypothetical protein P3M63_07520 [Mycobacteroides abscessus subsp. massiliense]CDO24090.1 hypothetical protein BN978_04582 [Mycolicibacterium mageritense DSM 44476 = CIP 104973]BBX35970.1 hypothetical protein MMAGJ_52520 [Mycolicibacterium mageritense]BBX38536.1 hypothetical protein MMAGJ_78180 [Mycolicibacterium mageritense]